MSETEKSQWLSDLAAVRQSDDAEPQLVDTVGTADVEQAAVASPWITLTAACGDKRTYAATLAVAATGLRDAIEVAAQEQVQTVQDAVREMEQTLDGADLADVAMAAREAGDRALDKGVFRPADGWGRFTRACEQSSKLSAALDARSPNVADTGTGVEAEAIRMQSCVPGRHRSRKRTRDYPEVDRRDGPGGEVTPIGEFRGQMTPETTSRPRRQGPLGL